MQPDFSPVELSVSDFVALVNQTFEYAFPGVVITGELANLRVSRGRWVYFDLKDDESTVKFFGNVYQLPGPLEDGMMLKVRGRPSLHNQYGFSVNVMAIQPAGEGSIKKAAQLLQIKLQKEGLFDETRKRPLPYPPSRIGLITSKQSAAYADFIKILNARWHGVEVQLVDVQVQGEAAPAQIIAALEQLNSEAEPPEAIVLIRGGGSPEDLAAFSTEQVVRAVAASRVPTLAAIGHEVDLSLSEMAADKKASTPSNAAELLVPDRHHVLNNLEVSKNRLSELAERILDSRQEDLAEHRADISNFMEDILVSNADSLVRQHKLLEALSPKSILERGYAIVRHGGTPIRSTKEVKKNDILSIELADGQIGANVNE